MILFCVLAGLFLFIASAYFIHSMFKYTRMINTIFQSLVYKPSLETFSVSRGEKMVILDSSERQIEALFVESKNSKKILLFCHESGAAKESWEKYAYFFPRLGFHVLSIDLSMSEIASPAANDLSQWPTEEAVQRLLTVVRWTKKAYAPESIVFFGISNGADLALAASVRDTSVKAVIADGLFSMKEIFRDYIRKWAPILVRPNLFGDRYPEWIVSLFTNLGFWYAQKKSGKRFVDVEKLLKSKHRPLLMIHGEEDDYVPMTHQSFLRKIDSQKTPLESLTVPQARHNQAVEISRKTYEEKITDFLKRNLL